MTSEESREKIVYKPGIYERNGELVVIGDTYIERVASALASPTRLKILRYLMDHEADVGDVAKIVNQSKANSSAQIRRLEEAGLLKTMYKPGQRGVKKICTTTIREIRIVLSPPE